VSEGGEGKGDLRQVRDVAVLIGDEGDDVVQDCLSMGKVSGALVVVALEGGGVQKDGDRGLGGVGRDEDATGKGDQLPRDLQRFPLFIFQE
jgi:hypothetical protein